MGCQSRGLACVSVCQCVSLCVSVCGISGEHCHLELQVRRGFMPNRLEFAKLTKGLYTIRHNVDNGIPETLIWLCGLFGFFFVLVAMSASH